MFILSRISDNPTVGSLRDEKESCSTRRGLRVGTGFKNSIRPEKFQFMEKGQNRNFGYKIVISVKNPKFIL